MCVCVGGCVPCVCERESERVREKQNVCERETAYVCLRENEKERERAREIERERVCVCVCVYVC